MKMTEEQENGVSGLEDNGVTVSGKFTPGPWTAVRFADETDPVIIGPNGDERITSVSGNEDNNANAAFIVRAVNCHDKLLDALRTYVALVGNTGYTIDRDSARELWEISRDIIAKSEGK